MSASRLAKWLTSFSFTIEAVINEISAPSAMSHILTNNHRDLGCYWSEISGFGEGAGTSHLISLIRVELGEQLSTCSRDYQWQFSGGTVYLCLAAQIADTFLMYMLVVKTNYFLLCLNTKVFVYESGACCEPLNP